MALGFKVTLMPGNGGSAIAVNVADLPPETQAALLRKRAGVAASADAPSAGQAAFDAKPASVRARAIEELSWLDAIDALVRAGQSTASAIQAVAPKAGVTPQTLRRLRNKVVSAPRAEWAGLIVKNYRGGAPRAEVTPDAWAFFLRFLKESAGRMPLKRAWAETRDVAKVAGWVWPPYHTVRRRWEEIPHAERAHIKHGPRALEETIPPQFRSVANLMAMDRLNLDGRKADVFARWEDGTVSRPIVIALQDVRSRAILGHIVAKTENADATKRLFLNVFDRYGLPDAVTTDNSRAFTASKISGGAPHRFRNPVREDEARGLLSLVGIRPDFAKPRSGRSKPIERGFLNIANSIDTLPEFRGAHCGSRPDRKPEEFTGKPVDIALFREVYEREIRRINEEPGRRTEAGRGKLSYMEAFDETYVKRPPRRITAAQRRYFLCDQAMVAPHPKTGVLHHKGFTYWAPAYQDVLLRHRGEKLRLLYDPTDRSKPVAAETVDGRLIADALPSWHRGQFKSKEDARDYSRDKAKIKKAKKAEAEARLSMTRATMNELRKRAQEAQAPAVPPPTPEINVIRPVFDLPALNPAPASPAPRTSEEQRRAFQASINGGQKKDQEERREQRRAVFLSRRTG